MLREEAVMKYSTNVHRFHHHVIHREHIFSHAKFKSCEHHLLSRKLDRPRLYPVTKKVKLFMDCLIDCINRPARYERRACLRRKPCVIIAGNSMMGLKRYGLAA